MMLNIGTAVRGREIYKNVKRAFYSEIQIVFIKKQLLFFSSVAWQNRSPHHGSLPSGDENTRPVDANGTNHPNSHDRSSDVSAVVSIKPMYTIGNHTKMMVSNQQSGFCLKIILKEEK